MPKRSLDTAEADCLPERSFVRRKTLQMESPSPRIKLGDYSGFGWHHLRYSELQPEVQAALDQDELWALSKPALDARAWPQHGYHFGRLAEWRVDWRATRALRHTPCAFMREGGDLGLSPGQSVVQVRLFFSFDRASRSSHWIMRLVLDPSGQHRVLPGIRGATHLPKALASDLDMDDYQNLPIDLCSSFRSQGDPEKDQYTPPYPLEDDMHAILKKRWQDAAKSVLQALEDPFLQAQIVHEVRSKMPDEYAALPPTPPDVARFFGYDTWQRPSARMQTNKSCHDSPRDVTNP